MRDVQKPILRSGDWTVRPIAAVDRDGIAEAGRDPLIQRMPWFGTNFTDAWAEPWVARAEAAWASGQHWVFSILDAEQRYAGSVVLSLSDPVPGLEVAYWTLPEQRGKGAATAGVRAVLPWAQAELRAEPIWAKVHGRNAASMRVLVKSGFEQTRRKGEFVFFAVATRPAEPAGSKRI